MKADDYCLGHVGVPIDNTEVRLIDAPEHDYLTTDKSYPCGETQMLDMSLMSGYFKNDAATAKTLSKDEWLSTSDIYRINPNNTISIVDQRNNLFKLSSGDYINFTNRITATCGVYQSKILAVVVNPNNAILSIHQLLKNSDATLCNISHNISKQQRPKYVELVCKSFHLCFCFFLYFEQFVICKHTKKQKKQH